MNWPTISFWLEVIGGILVAPPASAKARILLEGGEVVMGMEVGRIGWRWKINKVEVLIISEGLRRPRVRASRCFYKTTQCTLSFR
jgi:hypothetical protein